MEQSLVEARAFADLRHETEHDHDGPWQFNWPTGTRRTVISGGGADGGTFFLLELPAGYVRPEERALTDGGGQRFEWHSCHEEIFCLEGEIHFGSHYALRAPAYLNHPPHWVHPADQFTDVGVTLLIRNSGPVDFVYEPVPTGWDGTEFVSSAHASPGESLVGVTVRDLDVTRAGDSPVHDTLYRWDDGLVTQVVSVPAGWSGPVGEGQGEMVFVLDGDLAVGSTSLGRWGYSSHVADEAHQLSTASGARIIRWAR